MDDRKLRTTSLFRRHLSDATTPNLDANHNVPPDGGLTAWLQCMVASIVCFSTWGWANSFGIFEAYYTESLGLSASAVSWIGSTDIFLLLFVGTLTGRLTDAGYFRIVFLSGSTLLCLGIFVSSFCTSYWELMLSQGICIGIAHGCLFCPTMAIISTYFHHKRALVLGIASCGSAAGGLVFPTMARQLLPKVGFPRTMRAMGFVQLGVLVVANLVSRCRIKPRKTGLLVDWTAFKELEYTFYAAGSLFVSIGLLFSSHYGSASPKADHMAQNFWGLYFPSFYIATFSREALNPPMSYPSSLNLLLLLNGVSIIGRLAPNYLAGRIGAVNVFIPTSLIASLLLYSFTAVKSSKGLYIWTAMYGCAAAGIQTLFPTALSFLTTDLHKLGVRMGMTFTIVSFGVLTGPPIGGAIFDSSAEYTGAFIFSGTSIAVGCGFLLAAKIVRMRQASLGWTARM